MSAQPNTANSPISLSRPIRLVGYRHNLPAGGISNYIRQLHSHISALGLADRVAGAEVRRFFDVQPYHTGEILHIPLIMGSQVLLTRRYPRSVVTVLDLGGLLSAQDRANHALLHSVIFKLALRGLRRARHILAISEYTKTTIVGHLGIPAERITTTPLGVNHDCFYPQPQALARRAIAERLGLAFPDQQPVLLYVGSEIPRKNLGVLWAALRLIRKAYPQAIVVKVGKAGSPQQREQTQQTIAAHGLADAVYFLDAVDDHALALLYSAADIFVQPSLYEGFSLPTAEALASGCPVLAAAATCLPEIIGTSGRLFDPSSAEALANGVLELYHDETERQALIERGLARAQRFDWQTTARQTIEVYNALA